MRGFPFCPCVALSILGQQSCAGASGRYADRRWPTYRRLTLAHTTYGTSGAARPTGAAPLQVRSRHYCHVIRGHRGDYVDKVCSVTPHRRMPCFGHTTLVRLSWNRWSCRKYYRPTGFRCIRSWFGRSMRWIWGFGYYATNHMSMRCVLATHELRIFEPHMRQPSIDFGGGWVRASHVWPRGAPQAPAQVLVVFAGVLFTQRTSRQIAGRPTHSPNG